MGTPYPIDVYPQKLRITVYSPLIPSGYTQASKAVQGTARKGHS